ncbi:hypothetical protein TWF281_009056 [Arthrobotrys megalospora]
MPNFSDLPIELQTRILRFAPFTTQLVAREVCTLWAQIVSTRAVHKSRYVPTFTTEGLPNLHRLLDFGGSFRFTIKNGNVIAHKFWRFSDGKEGCEKGALKDFNTEWLDITDHPFLDEPAFSPFITYLSRGESEALSRGPRHLMILDDIHFEVSSLPPQFANAIYDDKGEYKRRFASQGLTVRDIVEDFKRSIVRFMNRLSAQPKNDGKVYDVVLTHGWRCWEARWVGVMNASLVAPEDKCMKTFPENKGRKKKKA